MSKRQPKFRRRQYKLNWLQIATRLKDARTALKFGEPKGHALLDEAIEALCERLGIPAK